MLEHLERDISCVPDVLQHELFDVVLGLVVADQIAFTDRVVLARLGLEQLGMVDQLAELEDEHPRPLLVDEQHTEAVEFLHERFELTDRRRAVDHHTARHRHRQRNHLEQVTGRTREDREPTRLRSIESVAHVPLDLREVRRGRVAASVAAHGPQEVIELGLDVLATHMTTSVHIEITGDDGGPATSETGQLADGVLCDRGHSTSLSPHCFATTARALA